MCVVALAWQVHPDWPLILIGNRDEFHARAAAPLAAWSDGSGIVAGRDLQAGGTWLGVHAPSGRAVVVTNVRGAMPDPTKESRGALVTDMLRVSGENDRRGVADAHAALATAYDLAERQLTDRRFAVGEAFTLADCAAAPALFYAGIVQPFSGTHPSLSAYFERLLERPSVQRTLAEAKPYFNMFPYKEAIPARFL